MQKFKSSFKVILLAGGLGTRLSEYTKKIPKPMVKIGKKPIIEHIMDIYKKNGFDEFIIAAGYKSEILKKYFQNKPNVKVVNTGLKTLTGLRLKKLYKYVGDTFFLTYGDGVGNVDIKKALKFHRSHKKAFTITAVHPPARFGELKLIKNNILSFQEKPQLSDGWINGGFFIVEKRFFKYLDDKNVMLEREPFDKVIKSKDIKVFKHNAFWQCMDTLRDYVSLNKLYKKKIIPWLN